MPKITKELIEYREFHKFKRDIREVCDVIRNADEDQLRLDTEDLSHEDRCLIKEDIEHWYWFAHAVIQDSGNYVYHNKSSRSYAPYRHALTKLANFYKDNPERLETITAHLELEY